MSLACKQPWQSNSLSPRGHLTLISSCPFRACRPCAVQPQSGAAGDGVTFLRAEMIANTTGMYSLFLVCKFQHAAQQPPRQGDGSCTLGQSGKVGQEMGLPSFAGNELLDQLLYNGHD